MIKDINITGLEQVSIVSMDIAQKELRSNSLEKALNKDPPLARCKVYHWIDSRGTHYWLPVMEVLRSIFAKSPEMARALLLYDGWGELVEDWNLENGVMEIHCTAQPKISDIHRLAWIASEPSLLSVWNEMGQYIRNMQTGISPSIPWPFIQAFTLRTACKEKNNHCWITEICNFVDWPCKYNQLYRHHPSLIRQKTDQLLQTDTVPQTIQDNPEDLPSGLNSPSSITVQQNDHAISRPKKFIHIQTNQYDGIDSVLTVDEQVEKPVAPCKTSDVLEKRPSSEETVGNQDGALSDRLSTENDNKNVGIGTKEQTVNSGRQGLEHFTEALQSAVKELGQASLHWPIPAKPLIQQKPKDCGSRWFIEMEGDIERLWCMARIQHGRESFYFLEVGRPTESDKLSLSTVFTDYQPSDASEWIKQMITNNGHWKKNKLDAGVSFLPHRHLTDPKKWGLYLSEKIKHTKVE